jgi:LCP family protein required for cell wall assembly
MEKDMLEKLVRFFGSLPKKLIFILFGLTILLGVGYLVISTWVSPLGPALDLPTSTPGATQVVQATQTLKPGETATPSVTPTPTIVPACGGPPTLTILVSGVASEEYSYGLADAIRVARVDFQTQQVTVLALPRELWVEIPGIKDDTGVSHGLLNMAYFYGTEGMQYVDGAGNGSVSLAMTLQNNFGLRVDHYLAVNLNSFREIIDAVGGIDICLNSDFYRGHYGPFEKQKRFLKAGCHHLDGEEAEILVRQRLAINPGTRTQYQTIVLEALAAKMLTPSGLKSLPTLIDRLRSSVRTDLSPSQISKLVCLAGKMDHKEDITFTQIPADMLLNRNTYFAPLDAYISNKVEKEEGAISELLAQFQAGEWP